MPKSLTRLDRELGLIPDPQERLVWITGLGRRLNQLPEAEREDALLVPGCVSRVWLRRHLDDDDRLQLAAAADSPMVLGLVALLLRIANGSEPEDLPTDLPEALQRHGIIAQLTPTRAHGLGQVWRRIRGEL